MNSPLFGAAICGLFFWRYFEKQKPFTIMCLQHDLWFTVTLSAVLAVGV